MAHTLYVQSPRRTQHGPSTKGILDTNKRLNTVVVPEIPWDRVLPALERGENLLELMLDCPKCQGQLRMDTDFLRDAEKFGVLENVPLYFRCLTCARSFWSHPPTPPLLTDERACENPGCGKVLGRGRLQLSEQNRRRPSKTKRVRKAVEEPDDELD